MEFKCEIICTLPTTVEIENKRYNIIEGSSFTVESQSIDKKKWFIRIPVADKFCYIEKYHFDFVVKSYTTYNNHYGEFQLPIIGENLYSYVVVTPTGYIIWLNKQDATKPVSYSKEQRLDSNEVTFR